MVLSLWKYTVLYLQNMLEPLKTYLATHKKIALKTLERQISKISLPIYLYPFPFKLKMPNIPGQYWKQDKRNEAKTNDVIIQQQLIVAR